jgi:hypothetical protein
MPSAGLEPAIPATKRPKIYVLNRAATGISRVFLETRIVAILIQENFPHFMEL